jgi:hypothetical protein
MESRGREGGGNLTNVLYKPIWNCYNESPLYNEYILVKLKKKKKRTWIQIFVWPKVDPG